MRMICLALCLLVCVSSGCKKGSELAVTGTVTLDDQPLANADVAFRPVGETKGLGGFGRTDANGKFTLTSNQGGKEIAPGNYKVIISKRLRPDGSEPDPKAPPIESDARETLPAIWSDENQTKLEAEVTVEQKTCDFKLTTPNKL